MKSRTVIDRAHAVHVASPRIRPRVAAPMAQIRLDSVIGRVWIASYFPCNDPTPRHHYLERI